MAEIKKAMPNSFIRPDCCLVALAKLEESLNLDQLIDFLELWHRVAKHAKKILVYLQKNSFLSNNNLDLVFLSKIKRKAFFQALRHSKKQKNIDDPLVAKKAQMVSLRNQ